MSIIKSVLSGALFFVQISSASAQIQFSNVTKTSGPFGSGESWGSAWGDFNADGYPDLVFSNHRELTGFYLNNGDGTFTNKVNDVDASYIWRDNPGDDTHGVTWADFDNDGDQDLFGAVSGKIDAQLLVNENNEFSLVSRERQLFNDYRGRMGIWFDYTNDGLLDIAIPTQGFYLYKQDAVIPGSFVRDKSSGLACTNFHNYGLLIDTNDDGRLDFICGKEGAFPHKAYDITSRPFTDITNSFPVVYNVNDAAVGDFNGDLLNDLVMTRGRMRPNKATIINDHRIEAWLDSGNSSKRGFVFKSTGAIKLTTVIHLVKSPSNIFIGSTGKHPATKNFTINPSEAEGIKSDLSVQGLYVGYNKASEEWTIIMQPGSEMRGYFMIDTVDVVSNLNMRYVGGGDKPLKPTIILNKPGGFEIVKNAGFIEETCVSVASGDFDNDTDIDLYMACRNGPENVANVLYENQGDATFIRVANAGGAAGSIGKGLASGVGTAESVTVADYDADGFLDLFVTNGLLMRPLKTGGKHQLFRNTGNQNNWVEVDLEGQGQGHTNRDGIGAKVYVTANNKTQLREQNGGYHRWSQNHQRLHFGLADADILSMSIEWPSGKTQTFNDLASNRIYKAHESGDIEVIVNKIPPEITIQDTTVLEMDIAQVTVNLSESYPKPVFVDYSLVEYTASEGDDFVAYTGTVEFAANQTIQVIDIPVIHDVEIEGDESFFVHLSGAVNAVIGDGEATIKIIDDDLEPELTVNNIIINSGDDAVFTVKLSRPYQDPVTLDFNVYDGRAINGVDYKGREGVVIFEPGTTSQPIPVPTINDPNQISVTDFVVMLSNIVNAQATTVTGLAKIASNKVAACGRPSNIPPGTKVMVVYTLCDNPDIWYFEGLSNGSLIAFAFDLQVESSDAITAFDHYYFEMSDSLLVTSPTSISANMKVVRSGYDIFSLSGAPGNKLCMTVNAPLDVIVVDNAGTLLPITNGRYDVTMNGACN